MAKRRNPGFDDEARLEIPSRITEMQDEGVCHLFQAQFSIEIRAVMECGAAKGIGDSRRDIQEVKAEFFLLRKSMFKVGHHHPDQAEDVKVNCLDSLGEVMVDSVNILAHAVYILTDSTEEITVVC